MQRKKDKFIHSRLNCFLASTLLFLIISGTVSADWIEEKSSKNLVYKLPYDCDSAVLIVRRDSRIRLNQTSYSIEQISDRTEVLREQRNLKCKGTALLSNSSVVSIKYGSYKDSEGDWIIEYRLDSNMSHK